MDGHDELHARLESGAEELIMTIHKRKQLIMFDFVCVQSIAQSRSGENAYPQTETSALTMTPFRPMLTRAGVIWF